MSTEKWNVGDFGNEVACVHESLTKLGFGVSVGEVKRKFFGPATREAVQQFQQKNGLPVSGAVDEHTMSAMHAAAATLNTQNSRSSAATPGTATGSPVRTATAVRSPGILKPGPGGPLPPGPGGPGPFPPQPGAFTVEGRVASSTSASVGGLRIQVVDKNVGTDILMAETVTDDHGHYRVNFSLISPVKQPDLQARVYANETFLAASDVRYNATTYETLNVILPANATTALPSEHETLTNALSVNYKGALKDLQETDERQDITYLANKTGWDAQAVAMTALADQFSQNRAEGAVAVGIAPAFYYALFRAGLPPNPDTLYQADIGTVERVWKQAIQQGVVPNSLESDLPNALQTFQTLSAQKLLTSPALAGVSTMRDMLTASGLADTQTNQFAELYVAHRTDLPTFWEEITKVFGQDMASRLQMDGKLGFLTLNNALLVQKLRNAAGNKGISDPVELAQLGYHRTESWSQLLTTDVPVPKEIPGDTPEAQRQNYADYLAAQVRLSYPTAAVAELVKNGYLPLTGAAPGVSDQVSAFLTEHQGKFEIGRQPVQQYIAQNKLQVADETVTQVKRVQRVFQITPGDQAMAGLMKREIDAAYHVVRYPKEAFVQTFAQDLGGADNAALTYDKSMQVHNAVLNIAISYLSAKNGVGLGTEPMRDGQGDLGNSGQILQPAPKGPSAENAGDVIAYPTLECLFRSMDFCACDHCRSILSPAAYLVDLLGFIDLRRYNSQGVELPKSYDGDKNPFDVLISRRPDVQHLPLTCENTNTALPYIDVVNETLEYFVANDVQNLSLDGYAGHDTDGAASEDLLASPQFVMDAAYTILRDECFPIPLPFHQPLENLRHYCAKFGVPLPLAMERLRMSNDLERGANPYGWRDILMEEIGLSRQEYQILTNFPGTVPLWRMYGYPNGTTDADVVVGLSNAKQFTRRVGITYNDTIAILLTRFVNPNSDLIPKLQRLGIPFAKLKALKEGAITDTDFDALLPTGGGAPDPAEYGGDANASKNDYTPIRAWVKNDANYARIMGIITLTDPTADPDHPVPCKFDDLELRYSKPMTGANDTTTRLGTVEFIRLLRFIRLWKKLGWTIEQTDAAICALFKSDPTPLCPDDIDTAAKLDAGFLTLLPRLGIIIRVINALNLTPDRNLLPLLTCWSAIGTHGDSALYRQMFLNPALLKQDAVFADNGYGEFLADDPNHPKKIAEHAEALRSAFNLTGDEYDGIVAALGYDVNTALTIPNISAIFRRGWLARKLALSVHELLLLTSLTGLDPFALPDPTDPVILGLISIVQALKDRSFKSASALYLIWNQDLSGKSAPDPAQMAEFARTLRGDYASIEDQFAVTEDPGGDIARARMALVYGQEAADTFFALLNDTLVIDVAYTQAASTLEAAITAIDAKIAYDDFRHRLSHTGILTATTGDALKAVPQVTTAFQTAVDAIFARSEDAKGSFFGRNPELKPLYDTYIASNDPPAVKRMTLLAAFRPELSRRRKQQQALQRFSAAASVDLAFTQALLDPLAVPYPLHAAGQADRPALDDVLALETPGLAAQFFYSDTATGAVGLSVLAAVNLDYASGSSNALPPNPTAGAPISGIWEGQVETPEAGFYNFVVEADSEATVRLILDGQDRSLSQNGTVWRNTDPLELKAGMLYAIVLTVEKITNTLSVKWETPKRAREVIPSRYLYPPTIFPPFTAVYVRFLKATSLASGLSLTANELVHFATDPDYQITGDGWLNALPISGDPDTAAAAALLKPFRALLDYARIKAEVSSGDESLLISLQGLATAAANADSLLCTLTRWDRTSLNDVLAHFSGDIASLAHFAQFRRVYDAFAPIRMMGIPAAALIRATTNEPEPGGDTVRDLQTALRARYDAASWRDVVQPINDAMRGLQRDALVAYILHQMRSNPATAHIDTADKLFEYFLMDVEMDPCMQTSRIRHALSSVQLFIERCLMNLEPHVSPGSINTKQWEWMKRYRVWEANRKVFLFPENWLEPELRDDKSPFFREIESELLQRDITEDSATTALLNYLAKLEEVAKLEPCGIHHAEGDPRKRTSDVDHVIARTAGAHRKYYYRRYYGYWTAWEHVKLDIEDNPVIPVVWNDRLLLFWLKILKQLPLELQNAMMNQNFLPVLPGGGIGENGGPGNGGPGNGGPGNGGPGKGGPGKGGPGKGEPGKGEPGSGGIDSVELFKSFRKQTFESAQTEITVQAVLCWSEYYNGKWQPTKTSDVNRPTELGQFDANAFDRSRLRLSVTEEGDALRVWIHIQDQRGSSFLLYNTHSLPDVIPIDPIDPIGLVFPAYRYLDISNQTFAIDYYDAWHFGDPMLTPLIRPVLTSDIGKTIIEPRHVLQNPWDAPFFFEDRRNVFFVTTTQKLVCIPEVLHFGITVNPSVKQIVKIPPLILPTTSSLQLGPKSRGDGAPVGSDPSVIDITPIQRFVTEDAYIRKGLGTTTAVVFGDRQIGPSGAIPAADVAK